MLPVKIHLKENYFLDYLLFYFKYKPGKAQRRSETHLTNQVVIKGTHDIGKLIIANLSASNTKKESFGTSHHTIYIPDQHYDIKSKFLFFNEAQTDLINKQIKFNFNIDFRMFCVSAAEKGIRYDVAIRSFIRLLNLHFSDDFYERLKKSDYRKRKEWDEYMKQAIKIIQSEAYVDDNQL